MFLVRHLILLPRLSVPSTQFSATILFPGRRNYRMKPYNPPPNMCGVNKRRLLLNGTTIYQGEKSMRLCLITYVSTYFN